MTARVFYPLIAACVVMAASGNAVASGSGSKMTTCSGSDDYSEIGNGLLSALESQYGQWNPPPCCASAKVSQYARTADTQTSDGWQVWCKAIMTNGAIIEKGPFIAQTRTCITDIQMKAEADQRCASACATWNTNHLNCNPKP